MSCCGKKRALLRRSLMSVTPPAPPPKLKQRESTLHYVGSSSILLRGAISQETYVFSAAEPEQAVHVSDVPALLGTGLFRRPT
jgi:hypothetical protein